MHNGPVNTEILILILPYQPMYCPHQLDSVGLQFALHICPFCPRRDYHRFGQRLIMLPCSLRSRERDRTGLTHQADPLNQHVARVWAVLMNGPNTNRAPQAVLGFGSGSGIVAGLAGWSAEGWERDGCYPDVSSEGQRKFSTTALIFWHFHCLMYGAPSIPWAQSVIIWRPRK